MASDKWELLLFMDSYLFSPSHPKTRLRHIRRRWCRWPPKQSSKLVSEDRKDSNSLDYVNAVSNSCKCHLSDAMQKTHDTHCLIQRNSGRADVGWVTAVGGVRLNGTIVSTTYNLSLDGGAQNCAQHLHHHTWERHRNERTGDNAHLTKTFDHTGELTYDKRWRSPSLSGHCWWT